MGNMSSPTRLGASESAAIPPAGLSTGRPAWRAFANVGAASGSTPMSLIFPAYQAAMPPMRPPPPTADGSLTEQGLELIVSVNGHGAGLRGPGFAGGEGICVALADDDEVGATAADAFDFFRGSDVGDKDFRGHAEFAGGIGDGDSVVATGRRDYAGFGDFASEQIGEGAAGFERASVLQQFQFKDEADRIQAEVGAGDFEDGRAAHVGPDDFFDCGDAVCVHLRGVHSCCYLSNALSVGVL